MNNLTKNWLSAGIGTVLGVVGTLLLTQNKSSGLRKSCVSLLGHGIAAKNKAGEIIGCARENVEDLVAEARYEFETNQMHAEESANLAVSEKKQAKKSD